jgi:hypothetical protein
MKPYIPHTLGLRIAGVRHVSVVGDFNNWHSNAHPLVQVAPNLWERIVDLPPGKHRYAFFVIDEPREGSSALKSRVIANGAVLWVPENPGEALSITAYPSMPIHRSTTRQVA